MADRLTLDGFLPYRMVRASDVLSQRFAALYKARYGISRPEWRTFAVLGERDGITATEIGRRSTMHKTKVSRAVAALEQRGWLTRAADLKDRRIEQLSLTSSGRAGARISTRVDRRARGGGGCAGRRFDGSGDEDHPPQGVIPKRLVLPVGGSHIRCQCASSQLSAARASTCSGTLSVTAGSAAVAITSRTRSVVASTWSWGTSKINSS